MRAPAHFVPVNRQRLVILGATGSVGVNTLDVVARHPDRFEVVALAANARVDLLFEQCRRFKPQFAALADPTAAAELHARVTAADLPTQVLAGADGLVEVATAPEVDAVMAAIVGAAG